MPRPPTRNPVTSAYGPRIHPITGDRRMHWGEDRGWGGNEGTTLRAPEAGVLTHWGYNPSAGNRLIIRGDSGAQHSLAHNSARWPGLVVGQRIAEGQPVSIMGSTGAAAGVHVHWEVTVDGRLVNPQSWLYRFASVGVVSIALAAPPALAPVAPAPIGDEMLIYANLTTNIWAAGIPFGGVWQGIPAGQGDAYVKTSGRELVRLSDIEFNLTAAICRQVAGSDVHVYADTGTNRWYLIGAGVDYEIPAGRGGLFEAVYGTRIAMSSTDVASLRAAFGPLPASGDVAGIIAAITALDVPSATENAAATRAAIIR